MIHKRWLRDSLVRTKESHNPKQENEDGRAIFAFEALTDQSLSSGQFIHVYVYRQCRCVYPPDLPKGDR